MKNISKDIPISEITLRKYEKPSSKDKRDLVRKICLSIGLLQPGDSRDIMVDILYVLLEARARKKKLKAEEVRDKVIALRKRRKLSLSGTALSNIRRQLLRLKNLLIIDRTKNKYRITEFLRMEEIFKERISKFMISDVIVRVEEYLKFVDSEFSESKKQKV